MNTNLSAVSNILGIPVDGTWDVIDNSEDKNLVLVHGTTIDSRIRGPIIDLTLGKVVCPSFGVVDLAVANHLSVRYSQNPSELTDQLLESVITDQPLNKVIDVVDDQMKHQLFDFSKCTIEDGHEGTILRVWFDTVNGITRYSTHKRIDAMKSHWIVTKYFYDMYVELGGPTDLFNGDSKSFQDQVLFFLVVHPEVQVVSTKDIGKGRLIFLGTAWDQHPNGNDPLPEMIRRDLSIRFPRENPLTLEEANSKLKSTSTDYRIDSTDFIVISQGSRHLKVVTPGYMWRSRLRSEEPNLTFMWYKAITDSYRTGRMSLSDSDYIAKYPQLKLVDISIIKRRLESGQSLNFELLESNSKQIMSNNSRLHNIFQIYLMSISPSHRPELLKIYQKFFKQRTSVSNWLYSLHINPEELTKLTSAKEKQSLRRINKILEDVKKFASVRQNQHSNRDPTGQILKFDNLVLDNIKDLITKEAGDSLYRLVRTMEQVTASK